MVSPGPRFLRSSSVDVVEAQRLFRENFVRNRAKFESEEESRSKSTTTTTTHFRPVRRFSSLRVDREPKGESRWTSRDDLHSLQITQTDLKEKKVTYTTSIQIQICPSGLPKDAADARRPTQENSSGWFTSYKDVALGNAENRDDTNGGQFFTSTVTQNVAFVYEDAKSPDQNYGKPSLVAKKPAKVTITETKLPRTVPIITKFRKFKGSE